jgi:hypothetical protein
MGGNELHLLIVLGIGLAVVGAVYFVTRYS